MNRRLASVSVDLDDLWAYQRTRGDAEWVQRRSYLALVVPRLLEMLDEAGCRATVFVVGADAARQANHDLLRAIAGQAHEIGNHSFEHACWLPANDRNWLERDVVAAEKAIIAATGRQPRGYRGPGYSWNPTLLDVLHRRGYLYDASVLPTFLGPLARRYFLRRAPLTTPERDQRAQLFGSAREGFRPVRPFWWRLGSSRLLELPITTTPVGRLPFHQSYLVYLSRFSRALAMAYFDGALAVCAAAGVAPSFVVHPLDLLGRSEAPGLEFFPGMDLAARSKIELLRRVLARLRARFELVTLMDRAEALQGDLGLAEVEGSLS